MLMLESRSFRPPISKATYCCSCCVSFQAAPPTSHVLRVAGITAAPSRARTPLGHGGWPASACGEVAGVDSGDEERREREGCSDPAAWTTTDIAELPLNHVTAVLSGVMAVCTLCIARLSVAWRSSLPQHQSCTHAPSRRLHSLRSVAKRVRDPAGCEPPACLLTNSRIARAIHHGHTLGAILGGHLALVYPPSPSSLPTQGDIAARLRSFVASCPDALPSLLLDVVPLAAPQWGVGTALADRPRIGPFDWGELTTLGPGNVPTPRLRT